MILQKVNKKTATYYIITMLLLIMTCRPADSKEQFEKRNMKSTEKYVHTVWNEKEIDSIDFFYSEQFVRKVNNIDLAADYAELKANIQVLFTAFPDLTLNIVTLSPIDDTVYLNWHITGTNTGVYSELPATGKKIKINGMSKFDFDENNKITSENTYYNELSLLQQLGYSLITPNTK